MATAIWVTLLIFIIIIGGMVTLLKDARNTKIPKNYDKSKTGYDDKDDEDDW